MLSPGSITNAVPDPDKAIRLQRDIQRTATENISSVAQSFASTVAGLDTAIASMVTPVTAVATSTATALSFSLTATVTVSPNMTRCYYTASASVYGTASAAFQIAFNLTAPSTGSTGYLAAGAAPFAGSDTSTAVGTLTGLTPGAPVHFTALIGSIYSGTPSTLESRVQALVVFQP